MSSFFHKNISKLNTSDNNVFSYIMLKCLYLKASKQNLQN